MTGGRLRARLTAVGGVALLALGCASSHGAIPPDGGASCAPIEMGGAYVGCPDECIALTGWPIPCEGRERAILACFPRGLPIAGGGGRSCFERDGSPFRVGASIGFAFVGEPGIEIVSAAGWTPCTVDAGSGAFPGCD